MKKEYFILLICALLPVGLTAQEKSIDTLVARFKQYRAHTPTEKMYAHLDRNFYLTGETLWFKLYNVDGAFHRPDDMSKVAYVELLNDAGARVLQAKVQLEKGLGHGSFFLPASMTSGNYKFRAYTNWMKNFQPDFYFSQVVSIVNPFLTADRTAAASNAYHLEFFPEGGNLVAGIESKVGFKISDEQGKGVSCNGLIETSDGLTVATFSPEKFGLGHFKIEPTPGIQYRAVLIDDRGKRSAFPFPQAHPSGYVMQLNDSSDMLYISVEAKAVEGERIFLLAHARNIIAHAEVQRLHSNAAVFVVDKRDLPEGITHFTIFDENLAPMCERLYFSWPSDHLDLEITTSQRIIGPRKKMSVSVRAKINDQTARAHASMSVYRIDSLGTIHGPYIGPYLLLTSDLTGTIESPDYYFSNRGEDVTSQIDNLMLTHGWRRFDWKRVLSERERTFNFLPEVRDHIVTAIISQDGKPRRSIFTYLGSPGKIVRAYGAWSNTQGQVRFEIKDFFGQRRILLQTAADSTATYDIRIVDPFSSQNDHLRIPPLAMREEMRDRLQERSIAMQVQDIYYYDEYATQTETPVVDSTAFYGKADATYYLDDYTRFPLMEEVMREYVPGVFVRKRRDGFHFLVVDEVNGGVLPGDPMILLDGVPVPDVDNIMRVDPLRVKKLEVVKRAYYLGQALFSGIVSYTTYEGDLGGMELDPRSISLDYDGLQLKRIFHKPEYGREQSNHRLPDQRHVLHWEPEIVTGEDGTPQVEFYTSDVPGQYVVIVQALSENGLPATATYTFTVTEPTSP